jgi:peroxiredoxin
MRLVSTAVAALVVAAAPSRADDPPPVGTRITDVALPNAVTDKAWSLAADGRAAKAVVVVFVGTECPVGNAYVPTLNALHAEYGPKGVALVGVNSNAHDGPAAVAKHAKEYGVTFPVLKDADGAVAARFRADRLATAFVLDAARTVRYRGRIDDQFERGVKRAKATATDLRDALNAVLAGKDVTRPATEVVACPINRPDKANAVKGGEPPAVTYTKHVSRIIQVNCQGCHRPGEVGPFELMTYRDARAWADAIREVVADGVMPPWHADPRHGTFANDRRLSAADRAAVLAWVDAGCPEGDPADLPPDKRYVEGWAIGRPDEVVTMNDEFRVPAQTPAGGVPYQYVLAGRPFAEDRWVRAAEVRPGNRGVVHHIIVHVLRPGQKLSMLTNGGGVGDLLGALTGDKGKELPDQLVAFVPGDQAFALPAGYAKRIPKGAQLVFELHYTPNGKPGVDRSTLGLVYANAPPAHEVRGDSTINWAFSIPPHAAAHRVEAEHRFDRDVVLRSFNPHMHLRGKSFEYRLKLPDGTEEVLLSVPRYDFNWQHTYVLAEPRRVPKGAKLRTAAVYDNSAGNPFNPDPAKRVGWGDQTWDEMMLGSFEYHDAPPAGASGR